MKKVVFYSNDKSMDHLFDEYLKREAPNEFIRIEGLKNLPIDEHTLLITFINPLSFEQMDLIYEEVKKHDSIWSLSYPYNNDIYFNNIYRWSWHVPCYKCVLAGLQNRERVDIFDEVSYQKIIEELYEQYPSFEPEIKLSFTDSIRIFSLLDFILDSLIYRRKSKEIDRTGNTNLLDVYQLNLRNKRTMHEAAVHWEVCDCYE
nr:McbB family protein [Lentilactobacillus parafarraginis]